MICTLRLSQKKITDPFFLTIVHNQRFRLQFFLERSVKIKPTFSKNGSNQQEIVFGKAREEKEGCIKKFQLKINENNWAIFGGSSGSS